ncbi:hypothetical protein SAMN04487948_102318 [Halogranum amylolyticum]|uniref:Uncharacterized protein n=1 Tax=Halogranum amylolyticum TaxID=660520 RepID=A0A1H8PI47_9EURY|nr:hypothetical protein [Halogranum amylolyticum]SEO41600.1 hypothetical protein SAMN04487948_102318 [Halogranum amylolyticum]
MKGDASFRPVQSARETSWNRLASLLSARNLLGVSTAVAVLLVLTTGDRSVVYPVFGAACLLWGLKTVVTASLTSNARIEMEPSKPDE